MVSLAKSTLYAALLPLSVEAWTSSSTPQTGDCLSRRSFVQTLPVTAILAPSLASAAAVAEPAATGLVSPERVAELLSVVPTFTIVDRKGAPFMVVGEDAKVTGYFFTEYGEARRILDLAKKSADAAIVEAKREAKLKKKPIDPDELLNPWNEARISTIPLDSAVTLATRSVSTKTRNYFQVAASFADIEDALNLTGKDDLAENLVPLFYMEDFVLKQGDSTVTPLYFRKLELEQAYHKEFPKEIAPPIKTTELFATVTEMVKPGGTDDDLRKLAFMPPVESAKKAIECQKAGDGEAHFLLGQRNIVL